MAPILIAIKASNYFLLLVSTSNTEIPPTKFCVRVRAADENFNHLHSVHCVNADPVWVLRELEFQQSSEQDVSDL